MTFTVTSYFLMCRPFSTTWSKMFMLSGSDLLQAPAGTLSEDDAEKFLNYLVGLASHSQASARQLCAEQLGDAANMLQPFR